METSTRSVLLADGSDGRLERGDFLARGICLHDTVDLLLSQSKRKWREKQGEHFDTLFVEIRSTLRYIDSARGHTQRMITPKKSLGQHFLRDANIARKIVRALNVQPTDVLLEIGSGTGALTKYLVGSCRHLIGVEVDHRAAELLRETFRGRLELLQEDILSVNLTALAEREHGKIRVVGNIPYYLTSEILFWLFRHHEGVSDATLMTQEEVARRLLAKPGTKQYGILSVAAQFYTQPRMLFKVSPSAFFPPPEVESAVVQLRVKETIPTCDRELFHRVVRAAFGKRRKTLRNTLRSAGFDDTLLPHLSLDLRKRGEELTVDEFVALVRMLEPYSSVTTQ
jgi:16S rRNA (adenine1518-N6/adenine1519-N6)-dimethyltransferase